MQTTLTMICEYLRNWFADDADKLTGSYAIVGGTIALDLLDGEYFRIVGSRLNDGVYIYPVSGLADEEFTGAIWRMRVPKSVLELASEIASFNENPAVVAGPYTSESFGGYSYSKAGSADGVSAYSWIDAFHNRLSRWRKVR